MNPFIVAVLFLLGASAMATVMAVWPSSAMALAAICALIVLTCVVFLP